MARLQNGQDKLSKINHLADPQPTNKYRTTIMSWVQCDEIGGALGYMMAGDGGGGLGAGAGGGAPKAAKKKGRAAGKGALVIDEKAAENECKHRALLHSASETAHPLLI